MMIPMQMGQQGERSWEDIIEGLKIQIANAEKDLILLKAQLKEAEKCLKKENPKEESAGVPHAGT